MSNSSLQHKTIRPGSLLGYSYYHSGRPAAPVSRATARPSIAVPKLHPVLKRIIVALLVLAALIFLPLLRGGHDTSQVPVITPSHSVAPAATAQPTGPCAGNNQAHIILVSISQRHLWACESSRLVYNTPVVTGIDYLAADKTPTGTYRIYDKQTDLTLTGTDSTGSWSDPVKYWMPFLNNQYGTYGLHDATWRDNSAFGHISPNSADASHGCVELPLAASAWLYNWAPTGTPVTIKT